MPDDSLAQLDTLEGYRAAFMSPALWGPHLRRICARHRLSPCDTLRPGKAGTYPTFIVGERWVVKLFGQWFEGQGAWETERAASAVLAADPTLPVPRLLGEGFLYIQCTFLREQAPRWPYLIYEFIPGISLGEARTQLSHDVWLEVAHELGQLSTRLRALPLPAAGSLAGRWQPYLDFLTHQHAGCVERHGSWGVLPKRMLAQIPGYLVAPADLCALGEPHLVHADLTADHLLGRISNGRWHTTGLIDFGDALAGGHEYELVALHLDLFGGDTRLLAAYLSACPLPTQVRGDLARRAMTCALLHRFNVLEGYREHARRVAGLAEWAEMLWGGVATSLRYPLPPGVPHT